MDTQHAEFWSVHVAYLHDRALAEAARARLADQARTSTRVARAGPRAWYAAMIASLGRVASLATGRS